MTGVRSVIVEAVKMDSLQKLCSTLEPLLRRVVSALSIHCEIVREGVNVFLFQLR